MTFPYLQIVKKIIHLKELILISIVIVLSVFGDFMLIK